MITKCLRVLCVGSVILSMGGIALSNESPASPEAVKQTTQTKESQTEQNTAWSVLEKAGTYQTMLSLFKTAGYEESLKGEQPHTVLVVSDKNLKESGASVDGLLKPENKGKLKTLVEYHLIKTSMSLGDMAAQDDLVALNNKPMMVSDQKDDVFINDAEIIKANMAAGNGMIHEIARLLNPDDSEKYNPNALKKKTEEALSKQAAPAPTPVPELPQDRTIGKELKTLEGLTILVKAIDATGLNDTLDNEKKTLTIFAPVNMAFETLPEGELARLLQASNKDELRALLTYHVVEGAMNLSELKEPKSVKTLNGAMLKIDPQSGTIGSAMPIDTVGTSAKNGVIYFIDQVLITPKN